MKSTLTSFSFTDAEVSEIKEQVKAQEKKIVPEGTKALCLNYYYVAEATKGDTLEHFPPLVVNSANMFVDLLNYLGAAREFIKEKHELFVNIVTVYK